jgi:TIR domain
LSTKQAARPAPRAGSEDDAPRRRGRATAERIFISYRRADSGGWARSLHDNLDERLGTGRAFRDVAMEGGMDFHEHVESLLDGCDVLLAIIGKSWTSITDADGNRRLDDPEDLVRREIARALQRPDVEVIPVLVDGARMPTEHELPPDLAPLARRQACELADSRWDYDVDNLARRLRVLLGEKPRRWRPGARVIGIGLALAVVAGLFALWPSIKPQDAPATKAARLSNLTLDRDITFGQYLDRKALPRKPYEPPDLARRGAYVAFDFRITGYKGKRLPLRWQLVDARTDDQLDQSRALGITPGAATDQGSWDVWVPLPRGHRQFYVQVQLYDNKGLVPIGRLRTERFPAPGTA